MPTLGEIAATLGIIGGFLAIWKGTLKPLVGSIFRVCVNKCLTEIQNRINKLEEHVNNDDVHCGK